MSALLTNSNVDSVWTEIVPPFKIGEAAPRRFAWFLVITTPIVYFLGLLFREGVAWVLCYLFFIPGFFGLGWAFIYMFWGAHVVTRDEKRIMLAARVAIEQHARLYGEVKYIDLSLDTGVLTAFAFAGSSLLIVQDRMLRKVLWREIRGWRWEIQGSAQLIGGNGFDKLDLRVKDERARQRVNGFFLQTVDPDRPEIWLRTADEAVCRRWEVIMDNVGNGRLAVD